MLEMRNTRAVVSYGVPTPPKFKLCPLFAHTIIHWQHSNIQLKHTNLHLQHSCQAFKMHSQQSNITPNIQSIKWNIQSRHAKFTYNIRTCTLNKRLFNSNSHLGHSTFNSTFHSNIRLVNWNIQYEYSIQTFNWNIRFENSTFYSRFNSNMPQEVENKCCGRRNCVSQGRRFRKLCLDAEYLQLCSKNTADIRNDRQVSTNCTFRKAAYRNYVLDTHGYLGKGKRKIVPSCCVLCIHRHYPSPTGVYMGFRAR